MSLKNSVGKTINAVLKPAGLRLGQARKGDGVAAHSVSAQSYLRLVEEIQGIFRDVILFDVPARNRRTELLADLIGTSVSEALYLIQHLHQSLRLEGDVCEFGVAQGATSALMANEIRETEKSLWLFDSFQGLPRPGEKDQLIDDIFDLKSMEEYEGEMACPSSMVEARLRAISFPVERVKVIAGFIEETITRQALPDRVCFAYVDFDFYDPILVTLTFLHERLSPGGFVLVDDYGFFSAGAQSAVDEFLAEHRDVYEFTLPPKFAGHFCIIRKTAERRASSERH
jgi:hypothetical protein